MSRSPSHLPQFHAVGFSGHRQVRNAEAMESALAVALAALKSEGSGDWIAVSSVASGSDTLFARRALAAGMAWHALLPLARPEFRKDFSDDQWAVAESLLSQAEEVRIVSESQVREEAYLECGMETVDASDVLVAVWDGEPARGKGGTADIIAYARELRRPVVLIDPSTGSVSRENFDRFELHDHNLAYFNRLPEWAPAPAPSGIPELDSVAAFRDKVDRTASRGAPQVRRLVAGTVLMHVFATLAAATALAFGIHGWFLPWVKLACLLGAVGVALALRKANSHHNWVRCRLAAEFARSAVATWGLPRNAQLFGDLDLPEYRQLLRSLRILHRRTGGRLGSMEDFKRQYIEQRADDQLAYYKRRLAKALPQLRRLRAGFWIATVIAVLCTATYVLQATLGLHLLGGRSEELFYYFLPISLPVVAAAFISLISVHDLHRRVARYREMEHLLNASRGQIAFCESWAALERLIRRNERTLLQEVLEWHSIASFSESH